MEEYRLHWNGPYSWHKHDTESVFNCSYGEGAGIYLWTVSTDVGRLTYYVGQTEAGLAKRHLEHWKAYFSGAYTVNEPIAFAQGRRSRIYTGYGYRRPAWRHVGEFLQRLDEILPAMLAMLQTMEIWFAELSASRRISRRIEGSIIDSLYAAPDPASSFQEPGMRRELRKVGEVPIRVRFKPGNLIFGLPDEVVA